MAESDATFDPSHVPPFPVWTLHLDQDAQEVALNGAPVVPGADEDVKDAGISAVVDRLNAQELEAVRVRVTTPVDDEWRMVVTADGDVHDTTPAEKDEARQALNRRRLLVGAGALALLGAGGGTAAVVVPRIVEANEPPPWQVPGEGEQIPVAVPPSFGTRARWAIPVGRNSDACQLDTGHIGTVTDKGTFTLHHPDTAKPQWTGQGAPEAINGAHHVQWEGADAVAVSSSSRLYVWPLAQQAGSPAPTATVHRLDTGSRAELRGHPFIELPDWFVDVPAEHLGTRRVTIPAGTRAALRDEDGTLHTLGSDRVHHLDAHGKTTAETRIKFKKAPKDMPAGVWAVDSRTVLAAWPGKKTRLALIRPSDGSVLVNESVTAQGQLDQRAKIRYLGRSLILVGSVLVSAGRSPFVRELEDFTPTAAHGSTLYGAINREPATLALAPKAKPKPWTGYREEDPPPRTVTEDGAVIIAPSLDSTVAYMAPRV